MEINSNPNSNSNFLVKHRVKIITAVIVLVILALIFHHKKTPENLIKVGITAGPMQQVMAVAKKEAIKRYGLNIEPVVFNDYQTPNEALASGDISANIFQTVAFLNDAMKQQNYKFKTIARTFIYPMGIFSKKIDNLTMLKKGAIVAIPNDPSNEDRALRLLDRVGLIKLKTDFNGLASLQEMTANPKELQIKALSAAQLPRVVPDVDIIVLNNDFVKDAGFKFNEALAHEDPEHAESYINVIVARADQAENKKLKELVQVMRSQAVVKVNNNYFPGAIKAWKVD
ncbi:MetQ/NlpA family ABC transporter substrate-binding protein [Piscirickettsia salmonis]|uniref:MetQ/NlpA family ABC transporter substrate-binding protein n=1 Tax=Piscirickettsia salmonis TaxID=1238 RepID=UPI000F07B966|nr:D-methionine-binding lipoprotein metQ [Piscirickettsiaceae bacterium NZ-RLO2]